MPWVYYNKIPIYPIFYLLEGDSIFQAQRCTQQYMGVDLVGTLVKSFWSILSSTVGLTRKVLGTLCSTIAFLKTGILINCPTARISYPR